MPILVDYRCPSCGARGERWGASPPPERVPCHACGAAARRVWAAIGLSGGRAEPPPAAATPVPRRPLCSRYPQVPGLCHMSESAGRVWLARYTGDGRALDRELAGQETRHRGAAPTLGDAITHSHFAGS